MKLTYLLLFGAILGLSSCMWGDNKKPKPDITTDTLTYVYKTIKQRPGGSGSKPDSVGTLLKIVYPEFNGQQKLNDSVVHKLIMMLGTDNPDKKPDSDLNVLMANFVKTYQADKASNARNAVYALNASVVIARQDSNLTTLQFDCYVYQGGAHGASSTQFINWDTKSSKNIVLTDVLNEGYNNQLTRVGDSIFRKQEKLSDTASLARDYFFKDNKFALNDNFLITPIGLRFVYNQYEIKPYAAGQTELVIPYAAIRSILRPNTVITQYLK